MSDQNSSTLPENYPAPPNGAKEIPNTPGYYVDKTGNVYSSKTLGCLWLKMKTRDNASKFTDQQMSPRAKQLGLTWVDEKWRTRSETSSKKTEKQH